MSPGGPELSATRFRASWSQFRRRSPWNPFGLTPAELDVLRRVIEGKTDAVIGTERDISLQVVALNLSRVYHKLGLSDRPISLCNRRVLATAMYFQNSGHTWKAER